MRFKMMAAVTMAALAMPAFAQTSDPTATTPAPKPKKEKKICREQPTRAGSNFVSSICKTKAEWAAIDQSGAPTTIDGARSGSDAGNLGTGVR